MGGSWRACLLHNGGEKRGTIFVCVGFYSPLLLCLLLQSSLSFILWWPSSLRVRMNNKFVVISTGITNTIACICKKENASGGFPACLQLAHADDDWSCIIIQECRRWWWWLKLLLLIKAFKLHAWRNNIVIAFATPSCLCCVRVYAHAHRLGYSDVSSGWDLTPRKPARSPNVLQW